MSEFKDASGKIIQSISALVTGILFGTGMIVSGMVDPNKVIAFLDVTGNWDPSLAFVMGGALSVFIPFYHLLIKKRKVAINGDKLSLPSKTNVDRSLIYGAILFGIGWGLAGFCPGPVVTSIGGGSYTIIVFMLAMIIGTLLANKYLSSSMNQNR